MLPLLGWSGDSVTELAATAIRETEVLRSGYLVAWALAVLAGLSFIAADAKADAPPHKQAGTQPFSRRFTTPAKITSCSALRSRRAWSMTSHPDLPGLGANAGLRLSGNAASSSHKAGELVEPGGIEPPSISPTLQDLRT
jgi:hypothetical protein